MASSRRTGTSEQVATYGTARDYTALGTWESTEAGDLVTDTRSEVLECYDDVASWDDGGVWINGATTNASYFRIVRPASTEGHDGTSNNGVYFNYTSSDGNDEIFHMQEDYASVQDLILTQSGNHTGEVEHILAITNTGMDVVGVIAFDGSNAGSGTMTGLYGSSAGTFRNCIVENIDGAFNYRGYNGALFQNCTAIDDGAVSDGFIRIAGGSAVDLENCLSDGFSGEDFDTATSWGAGSKNNASGDTSAPGTSNRTSQTFTFVNAGGNDYHLDSSDGGAKGFGADLSGEFDDDIDGTTITTWSIGADGQVAAATGIEILRRRRM